jgi:predicted transcriptional regulator
MMERARTKDETFMLRLYEEALKQGDIEDPLDRYQIGVLAGLQIKAVDTICNLLAQANFIKKHGKIEISITPHGIKLVESLRVNKK